MVMVAVPLSKMNPVNEIYKDCIKLESLTPLESLFTDDYEWSGTPWCWLT